VIDADNARLHYAEMVTQFLSYNSLRRALHSSYSPDLTSSDFWLFRYLKKVLQRSSFNKLDEPDLIVFN
jgi:hypothetical protein